MKNIKEAIAKPRAVALYASLTVDNFVAIYEVGYVNYDEHYVPLPDGQLRERPIEGWVRISRAQEVTFSAIDNDSVIRNAVAAMDEEERKLRAELHRKIAELHNRKKQLLALSYEPEESA